MAKRFIDTAIFRKDFIRGLDAPYKLLWLYIINECDHAGIWDVEIDVAKARLGVEIDEKTAIQKFSDKIVVIKGKWFIPDFIDFQYGELKPENRAHNSVIQILTKYNLIQNKPLTSPLQGAMDMDMVKDMDKGKDKDTVKEDKTPVFNFKKELLKFGFDSKLVDEWLVVRKTKRLVNTETALKQFISEVDKSKKDMNLVLRKCVEKSWGGFDAKWLEQDTKETEQDFKKWTTEFK